MGNSPSCNDGAAALVVMAEEEPTGFPGCPMARIVGYAGAALARNGSPLPHRRDSAALENGLTVSDIDLI